MAETVADSRAAPRPGRPRLLVVVPQLAVGGTEHQVVTLLPALRDAGFDVSVYTTRGPAVLDDGLRARGIRVDNTRPRRAVPGALAAALGLLRALRRQRPDIVHFFLPEAYIIGGLCAALARVPVRVMSRRSLNRYHRHRQMSAWLEHRLHATMDAVLANSRAVHRELLAEGVAPERLGLVANALPDAAFASTGRDEARRALGIADDALVLLCVANLIPYKGHRDLLDAVALHAGGLPDGWVLLLAGRDDGVGTALREQAERLGIAANLRFLGHRDDVARCYAAADIGLLCSHEEGMPNAVIEGMAAGRAMIVTDAGGSAEAVLDGSAGVVVPSRDPEALGRAIGALAADPARRAALGAAAQAAVATRHALARCTAAHAALYRGLLLAAPRPVPVLLEDTVIEPEAAGTGEGAVAEGKHRP